MKEFIGRNVRVILEISNEQMQRIADPTIDGELLMLNEKFIVVAVPGKTRTTVIAPIERVFSIDVYSKE